MTHTFNLDQIKKALENIDVTQAVEQGFIAYSEGKEVVPPVGEMIFEDPPGEAHIKYGFIKNDEYYVIKIAKVMFEKEFAMEPSEFYTKSKEATTRIKDYIQQTPLELSASLSQGNNCQVYLKMEHLQTTGSFKIRGASNMLLSLTKAEKKRGVITASSGNHAAAMVHLQQRTGIGGIIYECPSKI